MIEDNNLASLTNKNDEKDDDEEGSEEGDPDVMFKIKISNPEPAGVKVSAKNICLVTISNSEELDKEEEDKKRLIEYYLS